MKPPEPTACRVCGGVAIQGTRECQKCSSEWFNYFRDNRLSGLPLEERISGYVTWFHRTRGQQKLVAFINHISDVCPDFIH